MGYRPTATGATLAALGFLPAEAPASVGPPVSGYAGWWDATTITGLADGAGLAAWPDLSGHGHTLAQATGANQPTYYKTTSAKLINGLPAVWFQGTFTWLYNTDTYNLAPPFSVAAVLMASSLQTGSPGSVPFSADDVHGAGQVSASTGTPNWTIQNTGQSATMTYGPGTGSPHLIAAVFNGAASAFAQDASQTSPITLANITWQSNLAVGDSDNNGDNLWRGPICELMVYPFALSPAQIASLRTYAQTKWGTP